MKKIIVLYLLVCSFSCFAQKDTSAIDVSLIYNCWVHSKEEQVKGSLHFPYRPCNYKVFPATKYRDQMEFKANGECSWSQIGADDKHYMVNGTWTYEARTKNIYVFDKSMKIFYQYKIISLSKDLMMLEDGD